MFVILVILAGIGLMSCGKSGDQVVREQLAGRPADTLTTFTVDSRELSECLASMRDFYGQKMERPKYVLYRDKKWQFHFVSPAVMGQAVIEFCEEQFDRDLIPRDQKWGKEFAQHYIVLSYATREWPDAKKNKEKAKLFDKIFSSICGIDDLTKNHLVQGGGTLLE